MGRTLRVAPQTFRDAQNRTQTQWIELPDFVPPGEFERALHCPVAIWNHGFLAAAEKLGPITQWLAGDQAAL